MKVRAKYGRVCWIPSGPFSGQHRPVRTEQNQSEILLEFPKRQQLLSRGHIPQFDGFDGASGDHGAFVGSKGDRMNPRLMTLQHEKLTPRIPTVLFQPTLGAPADRSNRIKGESARGIA
jgi:hypothetical protein